MLEADAESVGGLARTLEHRGHRYDVGPHRFYTKSDEIRGLWRRMLPHDFVEVERLTRIWFERSFYPYPLSIRATLAGMGVVRSGRAVASWLAARAAPRRPERSFEDWVVNRFGRELYTSFFKTYTEKVWGVPCSSMNKDWAAQRIRGLSLASVLRNALLPRRGGAGPKSLIDRFLYPRRGAGQLWEAVRDDVLSTGGRVEMGRTVVGLLHDGSRVRAVRTADGEVHEADHVHATMTLESLVEALDPPPPPPVLAAGRGLRHRDFMTVTLLVRRDALFPDQWIYVHDPGVHVARITNFANWNAEMSPPGDTTAISMEYFCTRGDALWTMSDHDLLELAARELADIGFGDAVGSVEGRVHRSLDTYPVYDDDTRTHRATLSAWIAENLTNVHPAGRKGLHNYNSQDHAMMTGLLSARNASEGTAFDVWSVNTEAEYAEEGDARPEIEQRLVPKRLDGRT